MFSGLKEFMGSDLVTVVSFMGIVLLMKKWRDSKWMEILGILVLYTLIVAFATGKQGVVTEVVWKVLGFFGFNNG
ncbi:hypothetical protein HMPREF9182_0569 [Streptococcus sp. oral taxon 056 str. F0418]|uniref:hypothetical protein n=1 Tax=Streptococcus sp. oral taxon 056 TaxID=712620 RepID=UPI00021805B9|nr:hypothetical protein [Streptococcus sp. oral taxon 056]EGP66000.1 hypothetical protein HMPREF9182_0569 [Streptococcus sp. oral taxon 056 str. F0418]